MSFQKKEWFQCPPPLLRTASADRFRHRADALAKIVDALRREVGVVLQRVVEVRDVGVVMLAVMDFHRLRIDVRLEGVGCVGKCG